MKEQNIKEQKMQKYQKDLERYSMVQNDNSFFLKGKIYLEMSGITGQLSYVKHAIQCFTKSIKLKPNAKYYCFRAKAYNSLGSIKDAVSDLNSARQFPQSSDILQNIYIKNMVQELSRVQSIKRSIESLKQNSKLPQKIVNQFEQITQVMQNLIVKVGIHDQKSIQRKQNKIDIKMLIKKIQSLQKQCQMYKQDRARIKQLQKKISQYNIVYQQFNKQIEGIPQNQSYSAYFLALQQKISNIQKKVANIDENIVTIAQSNNKLKLRVEQVEVRLDEHICRTQKQFKQMRKKLTRTRNQVSCFKGKLQYIEGELKQHNQKIAYIEQSLKQSLFPKHQIKKKLEQWKSSNPQLYQYAHSFYWLLNNYFLSYRIASTGMFDGKEPNPSLIQKYFTKSVEIVCSVLSLVPGVGEFVDVLEKVVNFIYQQYQDTKFQVTVTKINQILQSYQFQDGVSVAVGKGIIEICSMKYKINQINDVHSGNKKINKNPIQKAREWLNEKVQEIVKKANKINIKDESKIQKLVMQDVALFITFLIRCQIEKKNPIQKAFSQAFTNGQESIINVILLEKYGKTYQTSSNKQCCSIY